jgi:hypothetical protein
VAVEAVGIGKLYNGVRGRDHRQRHQQKNQPNNNLGKLNLISLAAEVHSSTIGINRQIGSPNLAEAFAFFD